MASADPPPLDPSPLPLSYDIVWGGVSNIEAGATTAIGATSFVFDEASLRLRDSRLDHPATRALNLLAIQMYLGVQVYGTFAHEFFGHYGHAIRAGLAPTLTLNFPGFGGGTRFHATYETPARTRQEIASAGPEVTETIAYQATVAMYSGHPVGSYVGFYLLGGHLIDSYLYDQNALVPFLQNPTSYISGPSDPHLVSDPIMWALALTERYGKYDGIVPVNASWVYVPANPNVYVNSFIRDQGARVTYAYALQLLDPSMLNGLYGIVRYLVTGEPFFRPIMLGDDRLRVAPSIRANLGSLGAENYFDFFVVARKLPPFSVYYRTGGNLYDKLYGGGLAVREIPLGSRVEFGAQVDAWHDGLARSLGANVEQRVTVRMTRTLGVIEALGYKSAGGLMGRPWDAGVYGYVGLRIILPDPAVSARL